ncbi:MAG: hypothetical protein IPI91_17910 [Flavobacteriales bacterium]|nr:hypothetical protein [Flavobacteriales bacterium]
MDGNEQLHGERLHHRITPLLEERKNTVAWLRTLENAAWNNIHEHPKVGAIIPELFLTNWVAHDLHHLRQLINLRYAYLKSISTVPLDYAGKW